MKDMWMAVAGMGGLGFIWAIILVVVNKKFHVDEDPKIEKIVECLPGVNCGACGFAGCGAFGEAIIEEDIDPALCPVNEDENMQCIADIIGKELDAKGVKMVAELHCTGTKENVDTRADYYGHHTCLAEHITNGGSKSCLYGCLSTGDCVKVCPFDALKMADNGLPLVSEEKCTACGKCIEECPRDLFKLVPVDQKVFVLCSSKDTGPVTKKSCKVGCIGCTICAKKVDAATYKIENFLATVDYEASQKLSEEQLNDSVTKCPQNIISLK
ncbi:MAG: RnfABCDGE type electron transport complex subunit B [bacterium]|nr:RnfABCDGE type electron transport complex subunit B [bacterium]